MKKVRISELNLYSSLEGLYTIGTDANGNSVKVSLEWLARQGEAAEEAAETAREAEEEILATFATLIPDALEVEYPSKITYGNQSDLYVLATLLPEEVLQNVIFQSDNNSVTVAPDGKLTIVGTGTTVIYVIPTCNTAIYKTIRITVSMPGLRLVTAGSLRFTMGGGLRFT